MDTFVFVYTAVFILSSPHTRPLPALARGDGSDAGGKLSRGGWRRRGRVGVDAVLAAIRRGVAFERSVAAARRWAAIDRVIAPGARNIAGELYGE